MDNSFGKMPPDPTGMNPFVSVDDAGYRGTARKAFLFRGRLCSECLQPLVPHRHSGRTDTQAARTRAGCCPCRSASDTTRPEQKRQPWSPKSRSQQPRAPERWRVLGQHTWGPHDVAAPIRGLPTSDRPLGVAVGKLHFPPLGGGLPGRCPAA